MTGVSEAVNSEQLVVNSERGLRVLMIAPTSFFSTPADGAVFMQGDSVIVNVEASDPNGEVDNVKLYLNGEFLRLEGVVPYEWGHRSNLDPELKNMQPGTYEIRALVEDNDGETSESSITISVMETSSVSDLDGPSVRIVPTLASERISVHLPTALLGRTYPVTDMTGRVVKTFIAASAATEVSVADLPSGLYVIDFGGFGRRFVRR